MFGELVRTALDDLRSRPLRSALTLGAFAVSMAVSTLLLAVGGGLEEAVREILRSLGEGQLIADPGRTTGVGGVRRSGRRVRIAFQDLERIRDSLPSFAGLSAYFDLRGGGASSWKYSIPWSPVRAVSYEYRDVRGLPVVEGRWFTEEECERGEWVAVLNLGLRRMIFRDHQAVGRRVEWRGRRMTVVGVVRDEALFPYILFLPYPTVARNMADARYISGVVARPRPDCDWDQAVSELRRALAGLGGFDPADENALEIETNREFTESVRTVTFAFRMLVLTIALVSLLLGGLGVANMLAISVAERTREIGLRFAVGATRGAIFTQILIEAVLLAVIGGGLGLAGGAFVAWTVSGLPLSSEYSIDVALDAGGAVAVFSGLAAAGLVAAWVPARRAAALEPSEALRWE